jgi:hypothetical protein
MHRSLALIKRARTPKIIRPVYFGGRPMPHPLPPSVGNILVGALAPEHIEVTHDDVYRGEDFMLVVVSRQFVGMNGAQV